MLHVFLGVQDLSVVKNIDFTQLVMLTLRSLITTFHELHAQNGQTLEIKKHLRTVNIVSYSLTNMVLVSCHWTP